MQLSLFISFLPPKPQIQLDADACLPRCRDTSNVTEVGQPYQDRRRKMVASWPALVLLTARYMWPHHPVMTPFSN
jgi:hypothetical protein